MNSNVRSLQNRSLAHSARRVLWIIAVLAASQAWGESTNLWGRPGDGATIQEPASQAESHTLVPKQPVRHDPESAVAWEYSPYQIKVWLIDDGSLVFRKLEERIRNRVVRDARLDEHNGWRVECERAHANWIGRIGLAWRDDLHALSKLLVADEQLAAYDKLIIVLLRETSDGFAVEARELDLATRQWSRLTELAASEADLVPERVFAAFRSSFMPLTRIERVANEIVYVRTRATALSRKLVADESGNFSEAPNLESPLWVLDKDVLLPVIRREGRDDKSFTVEPVGWTYLTIEERQESTLRCLTHTAQFAPLAGRSGSSIKKFALVVRPHPGPTSLVITAQESKTQSPISGLEVYTCRPEELHNKDYKLLGKTDWRGAITVEPEPDSAIRYVIIRNGNLATKKPLLPGYYSELTTAVPSDRARVFAEGVLAGLRGEIIELAAMRATVKMRIQMALEKEQFERAKKIYDNEYLNIKSSRQVALRLTEVRERLLNRRDADQRQRDRIEAMFTALEGTLAQIQAKNRDGITTEDDVSLESRVLNKISTPPELPGETQLIDAPEGEEPLPPNKPKPEPEASGTSSTTTGTAPSPDASAQDFD